MTKSGLVGLAVVFLIVGCGDGGGQVAPVAGEAPVAVDPVAAAALYEEHSCGMCHGDAREGTEVGPALVDLAGYWDEDRMVRYLEDPTAYRESDASFQADRTQYDTDMPAFDYVSEDDRRTLARWLLSR